MWIDYFRGISSPHTDFLDTLLGREPVVVGDLVLAEILQGFTSERDFNQALRLFGSLDVIEIAGREAAVIAARNFRRLRELGVTVRKRIDTLIATRCIEDGLLLLNTSASPRLSRASEHDRIAPNPRLPGGDKLPPDYLHHHRFQPAQAWFSWIN